MGDGPREGPNPTAEPSPIHGSLNRLRTQFPKGQPWARGRGLGFPPPPHCKMTHEDPSAQSRAHSSSSTSQSLGAFIH